MSDSDQPRSSTPPPRKASIDEPDDEHMIKIMLATDNHIGYNERDPIRGQDSINAFKEVLELAVEHKVDFILLAGDLFHENRPSRDCLYQTMALLRQYTLGDKPIEIQLLSDPDEGKAASYPFPAINYEDGNLNVSIPIFSIHGNHDDPQGAGPEGALCALDMLSVAGLVNYMGKFDLPLGAADAAGGSEQAGITIKPVLLQKGNTRLGLYGVGNVKDQRMHFELRSNRVKMYMPTDKDDWFNILLVHQNRVRRGPQEYVPEGMFDDHIDLVVWGHEHDCRIIPEHVGGKKYVITQPGSSVATSLADGEALEKHVALLKIQGLDYQLEPISLRSVRPFEIEEVDLAAAADDDDTGFAHDDQIAIGKFLKARVEALIARAAAARAERSAAEVAAGRAALAPMLPLVRLKVDTTGFPEMGNPVRFGQEFAGRVANPRDVLVFHRAKKAAARRRDPKAEEVEYSIDREDLTVQEKLSRVRVQTLVKEYLENAQLSLLGEGGMSDAVQIFVEKDDPHAITTHVASTLKNLVKNVVVREDMDEDELEPAFRAAKEQQDQAYQERRATKSKSKGKEKLVRTRTRSLSTA